MATTTTRNSVSGYEAMRYTVSLKVRGTAEPFREFHENVIKTSPNYCNVSRPILIDARLEIQ
jgi:hypothetical protein